MKAFLLLCLFIFSYQSITAATLCSDSKYFSKFLKNPRSEYEKKFQGEKDKNLSSLKDMDETIKLSLSLSCDKGPDFFKDEEIIENVFKMCASKCHSNVCQSKSNSDCQKSSDLSSKKLFCMQFCQTVSTSLEGFQSGVKLGLSSSKEEKKCGSIQPVVNDSPRIKKILESDDEMERFIKSYEARDRARKNQDK